MVKNWLKKNKEKDREEYNIQLIVKKKRGGGKKQKMDNSIALSCIALFCFFSSLCLVPVWLVSHFHQEE